MNFLNPAILFGLFAASIPILIHLLNLRQRKSIDFSSLVLLRQIQTSSLKRFKIKEWLLLAIRALAIFFLVATFSKPIFPSLRAGGGFTSQTKTNAIIVIDVSPSMSYRDSFGHDQFKQAKLAALRLLDYFSQSDEIMVFLSNNIQNNEWVGVAEAKKIISQTEVASFGYELQTCITTAELFLSSSRHENRELYIISDFQASGFFESDSIKTLSPSIKLFAINVAPKEKQNTGVSNAELLTKIFEPEKPVRVKVSALQFGEGESEMQVSLSLEQKLAAEQSLVFVDKKESEQTLTATPTKTGFISGYVEIPKDHMLIDNKRYLAFHIPSKMRIGLVYHSEEEIKYLRVALESFYEGKFFELTLLPETTLDSRNFSQYDALIFCGLHTLSASSIEKTCSYVEQGGGLMIFSSLFQNYSEFNSLLKRLGMGEIHSELSKVGVSVGPEQTAWTIGISELRHPIFEGIFSSTAKLKTKLSESPNIIGELYQFVFYRPSAIESTILTHQTGKPLMTLSRFGRGGAAFFATTPIREATNFIFQPLFPPLLYRSLFFISSATVGKNHALISGVENSIDLPSTVSLNTELVVELPSGRTVIPTTAIRGNTIKLIIESERYNEIGVYRVKKRSESYDEKNDEQTISLFAMNISPKESDSATLFEQDLKLISLKAGLEEGHFYYTDASKDEGGVSDMISSSRYGFGVWRYLLALVLILLIIESALGRKTVA